MGFEPDTPDDSEERISRLQERIKGTREKMETETLTFIEAAKKFTLEWVQREMEMPLSTQDKGSSDSPDNSNPKREKNRELKPSLEELPSRIPEIVEAHLNCDDYWIHRNELLLPDISRDYLEFKKEKIRREITSSIRMILGCAAEIFSDPDADPGNKVWVKERGRRKYVCILRFSEEMAASLNRYFEGLEELFTLEYEIKEYWKSDNNNFIHKQPE